MNRSATAAEKRHMRRVSDLGCLNHPGTPAHVHHALFMTPRDNMMVIPLCPECHTGTFSIHNTKREFEALYGTEEKLVAETNRRLA